MMWQKRAVVNCAVMATQPTLQSLAETLAALQARQATALQALRERNEGDACLTGTVEATFAQLPAYVEKLRKAQATMDDLAARTANMRQRAQKSADAVVQQ